MSAPLAFAAVLATVVQVAHDGSWVADTVRWSTEWRADGVEERIELAEALPLSAELHGDGVEPIRDGQGRITGFDLVYPSTSGRIDLTVGQPLGAGELSAPLLAGPAVQRVVVDGLDFRPDDGLGFEKHTRYWAPAALAGPARADFERDWRRSGGDRARPWDQAVYLRAGPGLRSGIPGRVTEAGKVSATVQWLLALILGGVLALAWLVYRGLEKTARAERNASYIQNHFEV